MDDRTLPRNLVTAGSTPVERMYFAWNDALSHNDADGLLALYAEDAWFESPLVPHLIKQCSAITHNHRCKERLPPDVCGDGEQGHLRPVQQLGRRPRYRAWGLTCMFAAAQVRKHEQAFELGRPISIRRMR
ncbi:hypothetical protein LRP30_29670 [Bradyrhizobium sp. C-145]|uniref:hypothetical protein n=1 Tax=Bradyrhizobium sp. C-145 TaxID=574727 RepID=UPI00201B5896|nr:hypothetical protein [Bradyrhizobium sp. C-145]UQR61118.1 hypothetical protein LRP30_29670 [Bradyrhizobium sp. C-145]